MEATANPIEMLLGEDNQVDVYLWQRYLQGAPFAAHVHVVSDGAAALAFLQQQAPYTEAPTPDLILLDLYLLQRSGWEVLAWIKATPAVAAIPVVMLADALTPYDKRQRDRLRPTWCLRKPATPDEYRAGVTVLAEIVGRPGARLRAEPLSLPCRAAMRSRGQVLNAEPVTEAMPTSRTRGFTRRPPPACARRCLPSWSAIPRLSGSRSVPAVTPAFSFAALSER
jgi:CheY-like chemotaxis protein